MSKSKNINPKTGFWKFFPLEKGNEFSLQSYFSVFVERFFFKPKERFNYPHLPGKDNLNFHPPISGCLDKETKHQIWHKLHAAKNGVLLYISPRILNIHLNSTDTFRNFIYFVTHITCTHIHTHVHAWQGSKCLDRDFIIVSDNDTNHATNNIKTDKKSDRQNSVEYVRYPPPPNQVMPNANETNICYLKGPMFKSYYFWQDFFFFKCTKHKK